MVMDSPAEAVSQVVTNASGGGTLATTMPVTVTL